MPIVRSSGTSTQSSPGYTVCTPSGGNDVSAINTALASGNVLLVGAFTVSGSTVTVPAGRILDLGSATLTQTDTGSHAIVTVNANATLRGGSIVGNQPGGATGHGVELASGAGGRIEGVRITTTGRGINAASGATDYFIRGNRIHNVSGMGVNVEFASRGVIANNHVDTAQHGIQWWGGDSASSSTIGISDLAINGNRIRNVTGGIWGSLGTRIAVTGNKITTCSDVGIDFEGCTNSVASGNTVTDCTNACLSTFHGGSDISFIGNVAVNVSVDGAAYKAYGSNGTTARVLLEGNTLVSRGAFDAIVTEAGEITDLSVVGNIIRASQSGQRAVRFLETDRVTFRGNVVSVTNQSYAVTQEGGSDGVIEQNTIRNSGTDSSSLGAEGGLLLRYQSSTFPGQRNIVRGNTIVGFTTGIKDQNQTDAASYNTFVGNSVNTIYRTQTSGYLGYIDGNRHPTTPATATSVT